MYEKFKVVGFSHQNTPIEIREKMVFAEEDGKVFLRRLNEVLDLEEALILSTCNRTEIYYSAEQDHAREIVGLLKIEKSVNEEIDTYSWTKEGMEAVSYLFRVAMGLEAKVLGDIQISNQVKRAYQYAADENLAGPFLHRLMHAIFFTNKRVVQETYFRDGAASTSYACVELSQQFIQNFHSPRILILGVGEIGEAVADNMQGIEAEVVLTNRTYSKAKDLATKFGFKAETMDAALKAIHTFDVIISSVAVDHPLITLDTFDSKLVAQKLLVDLSVPRSIEADVDQLPGGILYNIDQIEEKTSKILTRREQSIPDVEAILKESVDELMNWSQEMEVSPTIKKLKQALDDIRKEELARVIGKMDDKQAAMVDKVTKNIIQKVIKLPVLQLKAACKRGEAETLVEVLNDLFDLEKQSQTQESK